MEIAYLSASIIPSRSANSIHVMKMCQSFSRNGHGVVLYCRSSEKKDEDAYHYYGVERCFDTEKQKWPKIRGIGGFFYASQVKKKVFEKRLPHLFYGRDIYSLIMLAFVGRPLIYEAHTPPLNFVRKALEATLFRNKNFKHLVVISEALRKDYLRLCPWLKPDKVLVAHDGADPISDCPPIKHSPYQEGKIQVGYIGHLYPGKGMEIISELSHLMPGVDFHVIGGTQQDIERWAKRCCFKNIFFHGFVPHGLLKQYFTFLDVLLAPYQHKVAASGGKGDISKWMSPLKIFEYMANGKAIVASNLAVLREVLKDGENCLLCSPGKVNEWKDAIEYLRLNPNVRKTLGQNAKNDFELNYTWQCRAEIVLD